MRPRDAARRLTGISTPFGGVSFAPPTETEREAAHHLITFLEDRRVLYNPSELEEREHCIRSVLEIRAELIRMAREHDRSGALGAELRAMAAACRKFLDAIHRLTVHDRFALRPGSFGYGAWVLDSALGELRGVMGIHIAQVAARYDVDVAEELATTLPTETTDADETEDNPRDWRSLDLI
jgi:hypothetical protein